MDSRSTFTQDVADEICRRLADGETLTSICRDEGMPTRRTVTTWRHRNEEFATAYDEAVLAGCHALLDETLEIADNSPIVELKSQVSTLIEALGDEAEEDVAKKIEAIEGLERRFNDLVQERKLRVWTRHELIKKKRPDVFSDKVAMQHSGAVEVVTKIERRVVKA